MGNYNHDSLLATYAQSLSLDRLRSAKPESIRAALRVLAEKSDRHSFAENDDVDLDTKDLRSFTLKGVNATAPSDTKTGASSGVVKAVEERRYSFAPVYAPLMEDAHGEYMEPDDLQEAFWDFSINGDRQFRLQHTKIPAGTWVDLVCWPYEHSCELKLPTGESRYVVLPAGTIYMGAIWEPWSWELVKLGKVRGWSMGGLAHRLYVDFLDYTPTADTSIIRPREY